MKALSIRQPWAWLIVHGPKDIENRRWHTLFRGPVLIHAGKNFDKVAYDEFVYTYEDLDVKIPSLAELSRGGIVGQAVIVDCVRQHESLWFEGPWGIVLANRRPLPFIPCRGQLGLFDVPQEIAEQVLVSRLLDAPGLSWVF